MKERPKQSSISKATLLRRMEALIHENDLLREEIRLLKQVQSRRPHPLEDERQLHLQIKVEQSITVEADEAAQVQAQAQAEAEQAPPQKLPSTTSKRGKKLRVRGAEKFEHLPVIKETEIIPEEVEEAPETWECIGEVTTFEVVVVPTRLGRHKITRKKFKKKGERDAPPIIAKAPIRFSTNYASISLAVYIVISKYLEHGALYRLEQKFARLGAEIVRQSQSDIVERFAEWVRPLYELIDKQARDSNYLQIDDAARQRGDGFSPEGVRNAGALWAA